MVGDGSAMGFYKYLVKKWNLKRVVFTGHQNPLEYYRSASVFLMTSSFEGWPMTLMEASQMGVPTVAFESFGALRDIIEDGYNGKIVPNNNINAFYEALAELMSNDDQRRQMCRNTIEKCREFEIKKIIGKWEELFGKLLEK